MLTCRGGVRHTSGGGATSTTEVKSVFEHKRCMCALLQCTCALARAHLSCTCALLLCACTLEEHVHISNILHAQVVYVHSSKERLGLVGPLVYLTPVALACTKSYRYFSIILVLLFRPTSFLITSYILIYRMSSNNCIGSIRVFIIVIFSKI